VPRTVTEIPGPRLNDKIRGAIQGPPSRGTIRISEGVIIVRPFPIQVSINNREDCLEGNMGYESERGDPTVDQCSINRAGKTLKLSLLFDGYYLKLSFGDVVEAAWFGRSGRLENGAFAYDGGRQMLKDIGPIPAGEYWILPKQLSQPVMASDAWGRYRITIHQRPTTNAFGRGGFFIHGGTTFGSAGCVDLAKGMDLFVNKLAEFYPLKTECFSSVGHPAPPICVLRPFDTENYIPLTVAYASASVGYPPFFG
jgi:hypothetical protein